MGYDIYQRDAEFAMSAANARRAHQALKDACSLTFAGPKAKWAWVDMRIVENSETFGAAMRECGFVIEGDDDGDVIGIEMDAGKAGDQGEILTTIAPYVERGCYIECQGEEGERWRWCFTGTRLCEVEAKIVWPDFPTDDNEE